MNVRTGKGVGAAALLLAVAAAGVLAQSSAKLYLNGKLVSNHVRMVDGVPYVPVADVAKGQGMEVSKRGDGYNLISGGGANQLEGKYAGKIGERVFTGQYGLLVKSVEQVSTYKGKYRNLYGDIEAGSTDTIFVVECAVSNGMKSKQELVLDDWEYKPKNIVTNTALADASGQSHAVTKWDVAATEGSPNGVMLLPGASSNFALVFKVPKDTQPKDLVFSFLPYDKRADVQTVDVRVSLQK